MLREYSFIGTLTFEEYVEAHYAMNRARFFWGRILTAFAGVMFAISGVSFAIGDQTSTGDFIASGSLLASGLLLVIYAALFRFVTKLRLKRVWVRHPQIQGKLDTLVTEEGMGSLDDKQHRTHVNWSRYIGYRESENLFVVLSSPLIGHILAKRLLQGGDVEGARGLLSERLTLMR